MRLPPVTFSTCETGKPILAIWDSGISFARAMQGSQICCHEVRFLQIASNPV